MTRLLFTLLLSPVLYLVGRSAQLYGVTVHFPRTYQVGNPKDKPLHYVALGDSATWGVGAKRLEDTYVYKIAQFIASQGRYVYVHNIAQYGATLQQLCEEQLPQLETLQPDILTIAIGANDAIRGTTKQRFAQGLQQLMTQLSELRGPQIFMATTPKVEEIPVFPLLPSIIFRRYARRQNEQLAQHLKSQRSIYSVDLYSDFEYTNKGQFAPDKLHPAPPVFSQWAQRFIASMKLHLD